MGNIHRSRTAEELYSNDPRYEVRSAGVGVPNPAPFIDLRPLSEEDLQWADSVFAADSDVERGILEKYPHAGRGKIIDMEVPDRYNTWVDTEKAELRELLKKRLRPYLGEPADRTSPAIDVAAP